MQTASDAAAAAFRAESDLLLTPPNPAGPEHDGRRRLQNSYWIAAGRVIPDPQQPRQDFDEMELLELTASIRSRGIKQPLTVRWNPTARKYMVIDGGRRHEAARRLQLTELPCWIQEGDNREVLIDQIVHNWQRVDLRPYETADALARLRDQHGLKQADLVRVTGKPKSEISKLLALHDKVDPAVQDMARNHPDHALTKRHLYNISRLKPDQQKTVAAQVTDEGLTAQQTEELIRADSPYVKVRRQAIGERQQRFKTKKADVLVTFRKRNFTHSDLQDVVRELSELIHRQTK